MADFVKGEQVVGFPFQLINKGTLNPVTSGVVTGFVTKDGGVQEALTGTYEHEGGGQWSINVISAAEMSADIIGLQFNHDDAVTQHFTIRTTLERAPVSVDGGTVSGPSVVDTFNFYGTINRAVIYFNKRLNTGPWDRANAKDREAALIMATRAIDKLNFAGDKNTDAQVLQFPRGDDTDIPNAINQANYEVALELLDGYDQGQEVQTIGVLSEAYSGVRTTYDASHVVEHIGAGIPSVEAWGLLKPFLRDPSQLRLSRVS